jgi:hypothetical protein
MIVNARFRVDSRISSKVFKGMDLKTYESVAIKLVSVHEEN